MTRDVYGWLFDVYPQSDGVAVWIIDDEGVAHKFRDYLHPSFFVYGSATELHRVCEWLVKSRLSIRIKRADRYDLSTQRKSCCA